MQAILVIRDDAERVASIPAGAELSSVIRAQNETAAVHGGESAATCLLLGHIATAPPAVVINEIRTMTALVLHAPMSRVGLRKEGNSGEKWGLLRIYRWPCRSRPSRSR